jgi:hypothetical protein
LEIVCKTPSNAKPQKKRRAITSFITISSQLQKKLDVAAAAAASLID